MIESVFVTSRLKLSGKVFTGTLFELELSHIHFILVDLFNVQYIQT